MDVNSLKRQHTDIRNTLEELKAMIKNGQIESDPMIVASQVNQLAGKLKIHLNTEDLHMYPSLIKSNDPKVRDMAKSYMDEMGSISSIFTDYKNKFNTKSKILGDIAAFKNESIEIFKVLENRINKEDKELYPTL